MNTIKRHKVLVAVAVFALISVGLVYAIDNVRTGDGSLSQYTSCSAASVGCGGCPSKAEAKKSCCDSCTKADCKDGKCTCDKCDKDCKTCCAKDCTKDCDKCPDKESCDKVCPKKSEAGDCEKSKSCCGK